MSCLCFSFSYSLASPTPTTNHPSKANHNKKQSKTQQQQQAEQQQQPIVIPPCPNCATPRRLEFQLMPSLLHVLEVDKHALATSASSSQQQQQQPTTTNEDDPNNHNLDVIMSADYGGMNWGVIAVYTCPNCVSSASSTATWRDEFLVVQASIDEIPCKRIVTPSNQPVFIKNDETFDALTNEGDLVLVCDDDNDDNDQDDDECTVDGEFTMDW